MILKILLLLFYTLMAVPGYCRYGKEKDSLEGVILNEIRQTLHLKSFKEVRLLRSKYFHIKLLNYERALPLLGDYTFQSTRIAAQKDLSQDDDCPSSFVIDFIRKENDIIYYTLSDTDSETADSFYNPQAMSVLLQAYRHFYPDTLSLSELFDGRACVYGTDCGMNSIQSDERLCIEKAVATADTMLLNQFLSSPFYEKKVYAYEAFKRLERKGLKLSERQKSVLDLLEQCTELIETCSGCIGEQQTVKYTIESMLLH